ncbi:MAG: hypothetical protein V3U86_04310 [Acidobacteriota bacterium]
MALEGDDQQRWAGLKGKLESDPYWHLLGVRVEEISDGFVGLAILSSASSISWRVGTGIV